MTVILARHGQTELNSKGRILGILDSPLTQQGRDSAGRLAAILKDKGIDRIFCSPLGRASDTAHILSSQLEHGADPRDEMAELSAGEWEGLSRLEAFGEDRPIRMDWDFRPPGGESYHDGTVRLAPFLKELKGLPGTTLVVGHFAINRSFLKSWLDLSPEEVMTIDVPHEAIYVLNQGREVSWFDNQNREGHGFLEWTHF